MVFCFWWVFQTRVLDIFSSLMVLPLPHMTAVFFYYLSSFILEQYVLYSILIRTGDGRAGREVEKKACFQCKRNTWHMCSKHILTASKLSYYQCQPLQLCWQSVYQNICLVPPDLNFMLGSYTFSLQTTIDHHGFSWYRGPYNAWYRGPIVARKLFIAMATKWLCDTNHTRGSSTTYVMIYKLLAEWFIARTPSMGNVFSHGASTFCPSH